jgi:hypothetical protein
MEFFYQNAGVVVLIFFVIAMALAPLFSTEHKTGVAQLLLTSKIRQK